MNKSLKILLVLVIIGTIILTCGLSTYFVSKSIIQKKSGLNSVATEEEYTRNLRAEIDEASNNNKIVNENDPIDSATSINSDRNGLPLIEQPDSATPVEVVGDVKLAWKYYPYPTEPEYTTGTTVVSNALLENATQYGDVLTATIPEDVVQDVVDEILTSDTSGSTSNSSIYISNVKVAFHEGYLIISSEIPSPWSRYLGVKDVDIYIVKSRESNNLVFDGIVLDGKAYELKEGSYFRQFADNILLGTNRTISEFQITINEEDWRLESYTLQEGKMGVVLTK